MATLLFRRTLTGEGSSIALKNASCSLGNNAFICSINATGNSITTAKIVKICHLSLVARHLSIVARSLLLVVSFAQINKIFLLSPFSTLILFIFAS